MGMTIEEIKNELRSDLTVKRMTGDNYSESLRDCLAQLLVIAEKYQKIVEIINAVSYQPRNGYVCGGIFLTDEERVKHIREVIGNGNND